MENRETLKKVGDECVGEKVVEGQRRSSGNVGMK
jgi:hypothetical protein